MTERELWLANPLAFWLDPDRWYGVPPGQPFWLHLDKRPRRRIASPEPVPPGPDGALPLLRQANEAEDVGEHDVAMILRRQAIWRLRGR